MTAILGLFWPPPPSERKMTSLLLYNNTSLLLILTVFGWPSPPSPKAAFILKVSPLMYIAKQDTFLFFLSRFQFSLKITYTLKQCQPKRSSVTSQMCSKVILSFLEKFQQCRSISRNQKDVREFQKRRRVVSFRFSRACRPRAGAATYVCSPTKF